MAASFAEQQLAKYGWKKGEGLGKEKGGIKRAITVSRRTDNRGVGSDANQWNSSWWDHLYNKASVNTSTTNTPVEETIPETKDTLNEYQGMFVRQSANNSQKNSGESTPTVDRTKLVRDGGVHLGVSAISDAELFAACEGRMARKGARAEQNGKLSRVAGDCMPDPKVAARIEAALSGKLAEIVKEKKQKKKDKTKDGKVKKKSKKDKKNRKHKSKEKSK